MRNILSVFASVCFFSSLAACTNGAGTKKNFQSIDTNQLKPGMYYYQCEMHPKVISDKAGKCSECNMELQQKTKQ